MIDRIALVTDFGASGPYVGQIKLRLSGTTSDIPVIDLISDLTPFRPDLAAYLLPAIARGMPAQTLYLCVVDPGVGGEREALAIQADGDWYLGPDNGLLALVARRAKEVRVLQVDWRPDGLSNSFHGRDLFAPVAAMLCGGTVPPCTEIDSNRILGMDWGDELPCLIYADRYGNLMTGLLGDRLDRSVVLRAGDQDLDFARTFCEVGTGQAFWYENALGLVELSVNQGRAVRVLGLGPGDPVGVRA